MQFTMNNQSLSATTVKVNVPTGMLQNARMESQRIGISVQDFIRMLLATYFAHAPSIKAITSDDERYQRALEDISSGKFSMVKSQKELLAHLRTLE